MLGFETCRSNDVKRLTALFLAVAVATPAAAVDCDGQDDGEPCGKPEREQRAEPGTDVVNRDDSDGDDDADRDACEEAFSEL